MTYSEKLQDPRWQEKRLEIMRRDNFTCLNCGNNRKPLHVHHILYLKINPWEYPDHLLQTLCKDCHSERQELTDKAANALRIAISKIPTQRMLLVANRICAEAMLEIAV